MNKIVVVIAAGIIQEIFSDNEVEVRLVDLDVDGLGDDEVTQVGAREAHVTDHDALIDIERTEDIFNIIPTQQIAE